MNGAMRAVGVSKRFGRSQVLNGLDLELADGAVTVLLGRNGAGKSTLLRLALGVLRADAGTLTVLGEDPWDKPDAVRTRVGYVPDVPDACGWMRFDELCRFARAHYPTWDQQEAERLAAQLEVPRRTKLARMSRGEGMKAMLVLALAPNPELLLLDEPFGGLDPLVREDVLRTVIGALREGERTVLCATHELDIAARIADRVALLEGGAIRVHGTLEDVLGDDAPNEVPRKLYDRLVAAAAEVAPC